MKKILLTPFIFVFTLLNASGNYELNLYETVMPVIFMERPIIVYVDDESYLLLKDSVRFKVVKTCDESVTLLIGENFTNVSSVCKNKPIFSTSYRDFKEYNNSFGAFYWRKGRPQIKFKGDALRKYKLVLPTSLQRYVE